MSIRFINAEYLWLLTLILLPIIIHLFNFKRYKRVYFSNVKFLQQLVVRNRKKTRLQQWLQLLFRILTIVFVVLAFARPYFYKGNQLLQRTSNIINIYIDNSFSMNANTAKGTSALDIAKKNAIALIKSLPSEEKIRVYSNNSSSYLGYLNKNRAIARILDIKTSAVPVLLSQQINKITDNNKHAKANCFLFSDFQQSQTDFKKIKLDSTISWNMVAIPTAIVQNLSIDSCWVKPATSATSDQLMVKVSNHSNNRVDKIPVQLKINDEVKAAVAISIKGNSSEIIELQLPINKVSQLNGEIKITDFPITYDNTFYFTITRLLQVKTLVINGKQENKYINKIYATSNQFKVTNIKKAEHNNYKIENYQLVVLNEIEDFESGFAANINKALQAGVTVMYIPGKKIKSSVNDFFKRIDAPYYTQLDTNRLQIAKVEQYADIYKKTFSKLEKNALLPTVYQYYKLSSITPKTEKLWSSADDMPLFTKTVVGNGTCYQLAFDLLPKWSDLVTHPIFVPTMINAYGNSNNNRLYYIAGKHYNINIASTEKANKLHLIHHRNGKDIIPYQHGSVNFGSTIYTQNQIADAGHYRVAANDSVVGYLAFNFSRKESKPACFAIDEIKAMNQKSTVTNIDAIQFDNVADNAESTNILIVLLIVLALFCFVFEAILQR